jgi:hypothetical protein
MTANQIIVNGFTLYTDEKDESAKLHAEVLAKASGDIVTYNLEVPPSTTAISLGYDKGMTKEKAFKGTHVLVPGVHIFCGQSKSGKSTLFRQIMRSLASSALIPAGQAPKTAELEVRFKGCGEPMSGSNFSLASLMVDIPAWGTADPLKMKVLFLDSASDLQDWKQLGATGEGGIPKSLRQAISALNDLCAKFNVILITSFNTGHSVETAKKAFSIIKGAAASSALIEKYQISEIDQRIKMSHGIKVENEYAKFGSESNDTYVISEGIRWDGKRNIFEASWMEAGFQTYVTSDGDISDDHIVQAETDGMVEEVDLSSNYNLNQRKGKMKADEFSSSTFQNLLVEANKNRKA